MPMELGTTLIIDVLQDDELMGVRCEGFRQDRNTNAGDSASI